MGIKTPNQERKEGIETKSLDAKAIPFKVNYTFDFFGSFNTFEDLR